MKNITEHFCEVFELPFDKELVNQFVQIFEPTGFSAFKRAKVLASFIKNKNLVKEDIQKTYKELYRIKYEGFIV